MTDYALTVLIGKNDRLYEIWYVDATEDYVNRVFDNLPEAFGWLSTVFIPGDVLNFENVDGNE